ncbi:peptidoglycan-binding protein [Paenibacillus chartarius]|uniref:Peptidoglycan-binding protein n=1 Tax=Paenibacillus chartarius TaxID=747481 RepID=A0ABV6DH59_9BACL
METSNNQFHGTRWPALNVPQYDPQHTQKAAPDIFSLIAREICLGRLCHFYWASYANDGNYRLVQLCGFDGYAGMVYINEVTGQGYMPVQIPYPYLSGFQYLGATPYLAHRQGELSERSSVTTKETIGYVYDDVLKQRIAVYRLPGKKGVFFSSKLHVDADGAYWAYHPNDLGKKCNAYPNEPEKWMGLECLAHAGSPGNWYGLATDVHGRPYIQRNTDPAPGYYVSQTTLSEAGLENRNPKKYVDAETIPYFVLPAPAFKKWIAGGAKINIGDLGVVINQRNGKMAFAIFADTWPQSAGNRLGEGSMALACALGLGRDPKLHGGTEHAEIIYLIFPGSGKGPNTLRTLDEINEAGSKALEAWGGVEQLRAVVSVPASISLGKCQPTLRKGEKGEYVKKLQKSLQTAGLYPGEIHGYFEDQTELAVKKFQRANRLNESGTVDQASWDILDR